MQDEKLARGHARALLRETKRSASFENDALRAIINDLTALYAPAGGPNNVISAAIAFRNRFASIGGFQASIHTVRHPIRKRGLVEVMRPVTIQGGEQEWLACGASLYDFDRHELGLVETSGHVGISHHALGRLHQRSAFCREQLTQLIDVATCWVSPIIRAGVDLSWPPGTQVAVPFFEGLLLGTLEANFHEPDQGPTFGTITRAGVSEMIFLECPHLVSAEHRCTLKVTFRTFVGSQDLFPNQYVIRDKLNAFGARHRPAMEEIRAALFRGYPDQRMIERFEILQDGLEADAFEELAETMQSFFDTAEWKEHADAHMPTGRHIH